MRQPYDAKREHEVIGTYPAIKGLELGGEGVVFHGIPESPRLYRPIEPRENYKMLLLRGEKPLWMPQCGWMFCDVNEFRPRQHPDNLANHQCMDGGEAVDYANGPKVRKGWFDLPLEWEPLSVGASVRPGNPKIEDMNDWESLTFPNLDDIN